MRKKELSQRAKHEEEELGELRGKTVLVTGGGGFIGSNICEELLGLGCRVRCLDDFSTGKRENIAPFLENPDFELIDGSIIDYDTCMRACEGVDFVSHQAAWGSVPRSVEMPLPYEEVNIHGTLNIFETARKSGVKRVVYASSSSVYGDEQTLPKQEGRIGRVLSPYALTKKVAEEYGNLYHSLYGLETIGFRYFNVFGKRQDPHGVYAAVIPRFLKELIHGEVPIINGDGSQSRDFTYVANVVFANCKALLADSDACGRVYNIACGGQISLNELYDVLCSVLGVDVKPQFGPDRTGDIKHSHADISLAEKYLGYRPIFNFEEGILLAIDWYKNNL